MINYQESRKLHNAFSLIGERGKSTDKTDASLVEWFLSRNACFWPTDGTNGHESFVNGFYGLYGHTSLNLSSLAIRADASNATHENL